jgi:hypothetical protein
MFEALALTVMFGVAYGVWRLDGIFREVRSIRIMMNMDRGQWDGKP